MTHVQQQILRKMNFCLLYDGTFNHQAVKIDKNWDAVRKTEKGSRDVPMSTTAVYGLNNDCPIEEKERQCTDGPPEPKNIALGKPAGQFPDHVAGSFRRKACFANDGNLQTNSHTTHGDNRYWFVDLGKQYEIERVEIYNVRDTSHYPPCCAKRLSNMQVTIGHDPSHLKPCAYFKGPSTSAERIVLNCPRMMLGRYVNLTVVNHYTSLHIAEVEVYGPY